MVASGLAVLTITGMLLGERKVAADAKVGQVEIVSPVPLPVAPASPAAPFQRQIFVNIDAGTTGNLNSFDVPAGKRLVIESVAGTVFLPAGQYVRISTIRTDFSLADFYLVGNPVAGQTDSVTVFNHSLKLYADRNVEFSVNRTGSTGSGLAVLSVSGYLVDI
jgi:hypothetical protein